VVHIDKAVGRIYRTIVPAGERWWWTLYGETPVTARYPAGSQRRSTKPWRRSKRHGRELGRQNISRSSLARVLLTVPPPALALRRRRLLIWTPERILAAKAA
jgi:hypothetical protein